VSYGDELYRGFESLPLRQTKRKYMKPGKTFKLSKTTKRMMALMGGSSENRNQYKRMMIDAQLCSEVVIKAPPKDRNARGRTGYAITESAGVAAE